MNPKKWRRWGIPLATCLMIVANAVPNAIRLNGKTTGSVSDGLPTLITPAGYAFSIWSLIYLALLGFSVYQARSLGADEAKKLDGIAGWYVLSCVLNGSWMVVWHYEQYLLSVVVMVGLLLSLLRIYASLDEGRGQGSRFRLWVEAPFSLYVGWIAVATVVNVTALLVSWGWQGGPLPAAWWSALMMSAAFGIAMAVCLPRRDGVYIGVLAWALVAIGVAYPGEPLVRTVAFGLSALSVLALLWIARLGFAPEKAERLPDEAGLDSI